MAARADYEFVTSYAQRLIYTDIGPYTLTGPIYPDNCLTYTGYSGVGAFMWSCTLTGSQ